jgi:hypothetical protein
MKTNPQLFPEIRCIRCDRTPDQIDEYVEAARDMDVSPWEYVRREEGTFNWRNGHFACTDCYLDMGAPSSPTGWVAP